jgi:hypothetical protein
VLCCQGISPAGSRGNASSVNFSYILYSLESHLTSRKFCLIPVCNKEGNVCTNFHALLVQQEVPTACFDFGATSQGPKETRKICSEQAESCKPGNIEQNEKKKNLRYDG